jgi:hypothetical protein
VQQKHLSVLCDYDLILRIEVSGGGRRSHNLNRVKIDKVQPSERCIN